MADISAKHDVAGRVVQNGLRLIARTLSELASIPRDERSSHYVRDITDCVLAAVKVQAEERAQAEFEKEERLAPEDVRALIKDYLAALPPVDMMAFFAEVRGKTTAEGKTL